MDGLCNLCVVFLVCAIGLSHAQIDTQQDLDKMAAGLRITYDVITNTKDTSSFQIEVTLQNEASGLSLTSQGSWQIHFTHVFRLEPDLMGNGGNKTVEVPGQFVELTHVEGSHFYIRPTVGFVTLGQGASRKIKMKGDLWSAARTDVMPNWYMTSPELQPRVISGTAGESLSFVTSIATPSTWKRYDFDEYNPYTAQQRYDRNFAKHLGDVTEIRIIPKPREMTLSDSNNPQWILIDSTWTIVYQDGLENEAQYLSNVIKAGMVRKDRYSGTGKKVVDLTQGQGSGVNSRDGGDTDTDTPQPAYYTLDTSVSDQTVKIAGMSATGVFYGVVTLINLLDKKKGVPECSIKDSPRFDYRGVMVDVSRNFHGKEEIIHLIQLMGRYKLNKLHFHLTDDEGWRLEIPALPELTEVGSKRCHDMTETKCLLPQIGSGPDMTSLGNGFYTTEEYKEILRECVKNHVELIPEFDMPGHARAAIKAMELRMDRLSQRGPVRPEDDVTLQEPGDASVYRTPQAYTDNAINPCLNSTYNFVRLVRDAIIDLHRGIQPLKVFHFGGDEVGKGAWTKSTICHDLKVKGLLPGGSPKNLFFQKVSEMAEEKGMALGAWEDGVIETGNQAFNLSSGSPTTYAYCWDNVWEWGTTPRTYGLANNGYKVVMAHGSHLYFDHPYEPDPEERGYYWATRFTDTKKTFSYNAHDMYANIQFRLSGKPITNEEKCGKDPEVTCPTLKVPANLVGMQGTLFSETTRTKEQLYDRLFPRVLAMAERAWHEAEWESLPKGENHTKLLSEDWLSFVQAVGHRELPRLEDEGVTFRLPPPGAKLSFGRLLTSALYPGLVVEYSLDLGSTWKEAVPLVWLGEEFDYRVWLRTRSQDGQRYSRVVVLHPEPPTNVTTQPTIDYMAANLKLKFKVDDNYKTYGKDFYAATFTLDNDGDVTIPGGNWAIYFPTVTFIESEFLSKGHRYVNHPTEIYFQHIKGYLSKMGPTAMFKGLPPRTSTAVHVKIDNWSASRYEQMPNWYVSAPGMQAKDLANTHSEDLSFVAPFIKPNQWKRAANDQYNPWTPAARFDRNEAFQQSPQPPSPILPTPQSYTKTSGVVSLTSKPWTILYGDDSLKMAAEFLKERLSTSLPRSTVSVAKLTSRSPTSQSIQVTLGQVKRSVPAIPDGHEAYKLTVDASNDVIYIVAPSPAGALHAEMSLLQLAHQPGKKGEVAGCDVIDWPRFGYRGMYADVSRNFMPKDWILRLLDAMAVYKLNKFHIHLCDDEGWRLEIPGLPELTEVGGKRCHDLDETECVLSTLGSGAASNNSGSGFYTVAEYRDILAHADMLGIEVIPEFDMPGHSHAAVKSMRARRKRLLDLGEPKDTAEEFLLDDLEDPSQYFSVQHYNDNAINPCLDSSYKFVEKVLTEVNAMHTDIQPLKVYHFGGDEVPHTTWLDSPACQKLLGSGVNLKEEFTRRVSALTSDLALAAWEDGLMHDGKPWERNQLKNKEVIGYAWNNVWEWGAGRRAYLLANAGYKVVLSPVTHLYFDHPNEPSPEERGFYWGTRYTDVFKAFSFQPDDYYMNIEVTILGNPITYKDVCAQHDGEGCPPLEKPENVIGIQGQLWTETVRFPSQADEMIFPRLLALAERAWHRASWEGKSRDERKAGLMADKARFAQAVGTTHLPLLELFGIEYRVPPPGARQKGNKISTLIEFPGLKVMYKIDNSGRWRPLADSSTFTAGQKVTLKTLSHDGKRSSREVQIKMASISSSDKPRGSMCLVVVLLLVCLFRSFYNR